MGVITSRPDKRRRGCAQWNAVCRVVAESQLGFLSIPVHGGIAQRIYSRDSMIMGVIWKRPDGTFEWEVARVDNADKIHGECLMSGAGSLMLATRGMLSALTQMHLTRVVAFEDELKAGA